MRVLDTKANVMRWVFDILYAGSSGEDDAEVAAYLAECVRLRKRFEELDLDDWEGATAAQLFSHLEAALEEKK